MVAEKRLVVVDDYPLGVGGGFGRKPVPMEGNWARRVR